MQQGTRTQILQQELHGQLDRCGMYCKSLLVPAGGWRSAAVETNCRQGALAATCALSAVRLQLLGNAGCFGLTLH
jgi:hypothetical protein